MRRSGRVGFCANLTEMRQNNLNRNGRMSSFAGVTVSAGKRWCRQASNDTAINKGKRGLSSRVDARSSLRMGSGLARSRHGSWLAMQCEPLLLTRAPALLMSAEHCPPLPPDGARAPPPQLLCFTQTDQTPATNREILS